MQSPEFDNHTEPQAASGSGVSLAWISRFVPLSLELLLVLAVVRLFDIEGRRHFFPVMCVVVGGFFVHALLPPRFRLSFFATLSLGSILFVLGLENGCWVIAIGGVLIGICCLPVRFAFRVSLLLFVGSGLVFLRAGDTHAFWPVLGSMFMFRLIIFLYDNRRKAERPPLADALAYFFLLPNVCFPLFPVVDYRTFRRTYYDEEEWVIYQTGVVWIVRGISHLLVYRFIKFYLLPAPYELRDVQHILLFVAANYALYLRVSGQFHLITGILHLFGFNLPRTHFLFFLAGSFNDIWRRINIYWKDFMMKIFFFPAFFALRGRGAKTGTAVVAAVLIVFGCTWLLHSWQLFWLRGYFPLTANDAALWMTAGLLVAGNSWWEYRWATRKAERVQRPWLLSAAGRSLRVAGMFALVSFFWACWTMPGFIANLRDLPIDGSRAVDAGLLLLASVVVLIVCGVIIQFLQQRFAKAKPDRPGLTFRESVQLNSVALAALIAVGLPWFGKQFDSRTAERITEFRSDSQTPLEVAAEMQGYYEDLNDAPVQAGPLLSSLGPRKRVSPLQGKEYAQLTRRADALLEWELIPGVRGILEGSPISINRFGMRDSESLTLRKSANAIRIALVGSSVVMGYGVNDDEVFGRLFEAKLNAERSDKTWRYEVLNFGVGRCWAIHRRVIIDRKVAAFEPDIIYYFAHQDELQGPVQHLARLLAHKRDLPYPSLQEVADQAGITEKTSWGATQIRLDRYASQIVAGIYRGIVDDCRQRGVIPVWVYLPIPGVAGVPENFGERLTDLADEAGFVVLELSRWWRDRSPDEVKLTELDHHVNALGHRLIAERLFAQIKERQDALPPHARRQSDAIRD